MDVADVPHTQLKRLLIQSINKVKTRCLTLHNHGNPVLLINFHSTEHDHDIPCFVPPNNTHQSTKHFKTDVQSTFQCSKFN